MRIKLPKITKGEGNTCNIDWNDLRIDIPEDCSYELLLEISNDKQTNGDNVIISKGYQYYMANISNWSIGNQIRLAITKPAAPADLEIQVKEIQTDSNGEEVKTRILDSKFLPYVRDNVVVSFFPRVNLTAAADYTSNLVFEFHCSSVYWNSSSLKVNVFTPSLKLHKYNINNIAEIENQVINYPYFSGSEAGEAKAVLSCIIKNSSGEIIDINGNTDESLEYTKQAIAYFPYDASSIEPLWTKTYLEEKLSLYGTAILFRENKTPLTFPWDNLTFNKNLDIDRYRLSPYIQDGEGNKHLLYYNKEGNTQLNSYYSPEDTDDTGYYINNFQRNINVSYGFPLPVNLANKQKGVVKTWSGKIADKFASGSGTSDDPYIISTPEELAKAILRDWETRMYLWAEEQELDLSYDTLYQRWKDSYSTFTTQIYYEVDSNVYAFNMNCIKGIEMNSSPQDVRDICLNIPSWWPEDQLPSDILNFDIQTVWRQFIGKYAYYVPATGFAGNLNGNGIIIYNLASINSSSCGLIPSVTGEATIKNIIVKNCFFGGTNYGIGFAVGGMVGAHYNFTIGGKRTIEINHCAVLGSVLTTFTNNGEGIAATILGNARYSEFNIDHCISANNYCCGMNGDDSGSFVYSIGGVVGAYQRGNSTYITLDYILMLNNSFTPKGNYETSDLNYQGWIVANDGAGHAAWDKNGDPVIVKLKSGQVIIADETQIILPENNSEAFDEDGELKELRDENGKLTYYYRYAVTFQYGVDGEEDYRYEKAHIESSYLPTDLQNKYLKIIPKNNHMGYWPSTKLSLSHCQTNINGQWETEDFLDENPRNKFYNNDYYIKYYPQWDINWFTSSRIYNFSSINQKYTIDTGVVPLSETYTQAHEGDVVWLEVSPIYNENIINESANQHSQLIHLTRNTTVYIKPPSSYKYKPYKIFIRQEDGSYVQAYRIYVKDSDGNYHETI